MFESTFYLQIGTLPVTHVYAPIFPLRLTMDLLHMSLDLVLKKELKEAVEIACDFIQESIECTLSNLNYNWYGVEFESALRNLSQKL